MTVGANILVILALFFFWVMSPMAIHYNPNEPDWEALLSNEDSKSDVSNSNQSEKRMHWGE